MATEISVPLLGETDSGDGGGSPYSVVGEAPEYQSMVDHDIAVEEKRNKLGTLNGCYVPCLLNIMGIVLYLRLGFAVGQAGVWLSLAILVIAETQAILTVLSLSSLITNGNMAGSGGGSYFLISRSMGPGLGGAIGVLFYLGYAVGTSFYVVGFATEIQTTWFPVCHTDSADEACFHGDAGWLIRGIGTGCNLLLLGVSWAGAEFFSRFNIIFFAIQMASILYGLVSFLVPHTYDGTNTDNGELLENRPCEFPKHLHNNIIGTTQNAPVDGLVRFPHYEKNAVCADEVCGFNIIFAILFPMATGIMEGANLSGDLKDPSKSIPKGTLWAIGTAVITYTSLIIAIGGAFPGSDLRNNLTIFQDANFGTVYLAVVGIMISSASSALGSLFGGSRVLQAIARDKIFPFLTVFAKGSVHGDEPRRAVLMTFLISQSCTLIGDLDIIAPIITAFFCMSYALTNFTCFALSITGAPNFRPTFRYWSRWTALLGSILNIAIMFYLSWLYGVIGVVMLLGLWMYLSMKGPEVDWGDVSQALMLSQARRFLLRIDQTHTHPKFWRPNLMLLSDGVLPGVVGFCNNLKKGGLFLVGHVVVGDLDAQNSTAKEINLSWVNYLKRVAVKGFPQITTAPDARVGYQALMQCGGLGGMRINSVVLPLPPVTVQDAERQTDASGPEFYNSLSMQLRRRHYADTTGYTLDSMAPGAGNRLVGPLSQPRTFCGLINDALKLEKNVLVNCNGEAGIWNKKGHLKFENNSRMNIDVWIVGEWGYGDAMPGEYNSVWGYATPTEYMFTQSGAVLPVGNHANASTSGTPAFEGLLSLLIQLGQTLHQSRINKASRLSRKSRVSCLRILHLSTSPTRGTLAQQEAAIHQERMLKLCSLARLRVEDKNVRVIMQDELVRTLPAYSEACGELGPEDNLPRLDELPPETRNRVVNQLIQRESPVSETCQIFSILPKPPSGASPEAAQAYVSSLHQLTADLAPVALVACGETVPLISDSM